MARPLGKSVHGAGTLVLLLMLAFAGHTVAKADYLKKDAKTLHNGLMPTAALQTTREVQLAQSSMIAPSGKYRIPPAGTIAKYKCEGGDADSIKYYIEKVEDDTLTVKVTGDDKNFGTYRRKAWQTVGTTLYLELNFKGKTFKANKTADLLSEIGSLAASYFQPVKIRGIQSLRRFMVIGEPPVDPSEIALRSNNMFAYEHYQRTHRFEVLLTVLERRQEATENFGFQDIVPVVERRAGIFTPDSHGSGDSTTWHSTLKSDFAPALGFALRQIYQHENRERVSCELTTIEGPGARYVVMGPMTPRETASAVGATRRVQPNVASLVSKIIVKPNVSPLPVKQNAELDTKPPALEVVESVQTKVPVIVIAGRALDQSAIAEVSIEGTPLHVSADGRFTIRRGVQIGESILTVAAMDVWGNQTSQTIRVNRTITRQKTRSSTLLSSAAIVEDKRPPVIETMKSLKTNLGSNSIKGRVTDQSKVKFLTVEGEQVALGADGRFDVVRDLPVGRSELSIVAIDEWGNRAETVISVLRQPRVPQINFGNYHALVIGNDSYTDFPKLRTAVADAEAVASILSSKYGFEVKLILNTTREDIIDSLFELRSKLSEQDNLVVYYAGHGSLDKRVDRGYWIPVNARIDRRSRWVSNADITDAIKGIRAKHILVIADSCYSGRITRSAKTVDHSSGFIARMVEKPARIVMTSGGLEPVTDSGGGDHSIFASKLLSVLSENKGVIVGTEVFQEVRRRVVLNADQTPEYSEIRFTGYDGGGDFVFVRSQ